MRRPRAEVVPLIESTAIRAGSSVRAALQVTLPEGLHTQSDKPRDPTVIPTVLTVDVPAAALWTGALATERSGNHRDDTF